MKRILALVLSVLLVLSVGMTSTLASTGYTCTVNYFLMNEDMTTYSLNKTETTVMSDEGFSPIVYEYEGFCSPTQKSVTADRNRTVNYFYERETYTITYVTPQSNDTPESQVKIYGVDAKVTKLIPEREGYTFAGWTDSEDSTDIVYNSGDTIKVEEDIILYALWNINTYIISFDSNGGSICDAVAYEYGSAYTNLPIPTKHGYNFSGWYFDSNLTDLVDGDDRVGATGDSILYAGWTARNIVSLEINSLPDKTECFTGDLPDTKGLVLSAKYDNGEIELITDGYEIQCQSLNNAGVYEVTAIYEGLSCKYNLNVIETKIEKLSVKKLPNNLTYYVDDDLDTAGMILEVTYNNGKTKLVSNDYVAEYDFSSNGVKTVTIGYTEYGVTVSGTFEVTVIESPLIYSKNIEVEKGQTVAVPIYIKNNSGLMGYHIKLTYDSNALTPVSTKVSELFASGFYNDNITTNMQGELSAVWTGTDVVAEDGLLFTAYFKAEDVASSDYEIVVSYEEADTITEGYKEVNLLCTNFNLTIKNDSYVVIPKLYSEDIKSDTENKAILPIYIKDAQSLDRISLVISYDEALMIPKAVTTEFGNAEFVYDDSTLLVNISNLEINSSDELLATVEFELSDLANGNYNICISSDVAISTDVELNVINDEYTDSTKIYADEYAVEDHMITVPICIASNNGIMGYKINVDFDSTILRVSSVSCGDAFMSGLFNYYADESGISIVWNNTENISNDGILFTISFERLEYNDFSTAINLSYLQEDTFDEAWNDVVLECETVTIKANASKVIGDVNEDKLLNLKDIVILKRYLAGGYDVSVAYRNADINKDNRVDVVDIMILERYLDGSFEEVKQWF